MAGATAGAAAAAAANLQALKASGVLVRMNPADFQKILNRAEDPLVVTSQGGIFGVGVNYQYLTSYKGLAFFTRPKEPLMMPSGAELVAAEQIWIPG